MRRLPLILLALGLASACYRVTAEIEDGGWGPESSDTGSSGTGSASSHSGTSTSSLPYSTIASSAGSSTFSSGSSSLSSSTSSSSGGSSSSSSGYDAGPCESDSQCGDGGNYCNFTTEPCGGLLGNSVIVPGTCLDAVPTDQACLADGDCGPGDYCDLPCTHPGCEGVCTPVTCAQPPQACAAGCWPTAVPHACNECICVACCLTCE